MFISDQLNSAIIAGVVSLIVSALAYIPAILKLRAEKEALKHTLARNFTGRLYELRLKHYPEAFTITVNLRRKTDWTDEELPAKFREINDALKKWKSGEPSLILSAKSLRAYYELQKAFSGKLALGTKYNNEQIERICRLRNDFLDNLRNDIGLLFEEEEPYDPSSIYRTANLKKSQN